MNDTKSDTIIHVAQGDSGYYFLKPNEQGSYIWYLGDKPTDISAPKISEAIRLGYKAFALDHFKPLSCGIKLTLPERDEHGSPALYRDMLQSLASPNGIYFDTELGHNCIVQQIPSVRLKQFA